MANSNDKGRSGRSSREFNFAGFMWRFIASLALVVASYNPTQYSFWGWVYAARGSEGLGPEHFVVGVTY